MKKVIKKTEFISPTANGEAVVDGSYAKITAIYGNSKKNDNEEVVHSTFAGIYSHNKNVLPINFTVDSSFYDLSQNLINLINTGKYNTITVTQEYKLDYTSQFSDFNLKIYVKYANDNEPQIVQSENSYCIGSYVKRRVTLNLEPIDSEHYVSYCDIYFNGSTPFGLNPKWSSINNQIILSNEVNAYTEPKNSISKLSQVITLRQAQDNKDIRDIYFPEQGLIIRNVGSDGNALSSPIEENAPLFCNYYVAYNNGFERIFSSVIDGDGYYNQVNDSACCPILEVEYLIERTQYKDNTRFDFFRLDGESFSGIGYENLKTTNQMTYSEEPSRQEEGSMQNIEEFTSFVLGAGDIGFSLMSEETYRRLKEKLLSKRTFEVEYYDSDFDRFIKRNMYVKPQDLQAFLSYGNRIIGMRNFTISFVATMNEEDKIKTTFYTDSTKSNKLAELFTLWGRAIETPEPPEGYNSWLIIKSGFNNNNYFKIKGKKQLNIFGETELIPIKD